MALLTHIVKLFAIALLLVAGTSLVVFALVRPSVQATVNRLEVAPR